MTITQLLYPNKPWLFKRQIIDETFGRIWYNKSKLQPEEDHYQGHIFFEPINKEIDVYIFCTIDGINKFQKDTFKNIEVTYSDLIKQNEETIRGKISNSLDSEVSLVYFTAKYNLYAITIPDRKHCWTLMYEKINDPCKRILLKFEKMKLQDIEILIEEGHVTQSPVTTNKTADTIFLVSFIVLFFCYLYLIIEGKKINAKIIINLFIIGVCIHAFSRRLKK